MAKVVLSTGGAIVQQRFVDKETIAIGAQADNGIVIDDPAVDAKHAAILCIGNDHILEDLGSRAGTLVNGTRIMRHILQHGDVVQLGSFYLRYVNPRASEADFDRTMLIPGLPGLSDAAGQAPQASGPAPRSRVRFPSASARMTAGPRAGQTVALDRVIATFGRSGHGLAVVTRRPHGYFVTHVEGRRPRVNGATIGTQPRALAQGDRVEAGDEAFDFMLD